MTTREATGPHVSTTALTQPDARRSERLSLRVAVVSTTPLITSGLFALLSADVGRVGVAIAADPGPQLESLDRAHRPDVAIYDLAAGDDGLEVVLGRLLARSPVIALQHPGQRDAARRALDAGAAEVIPLAVSGEELLLAVERAVAGRQVSVEERRDRRAEELMRLYGLSPRELQVLKSIGSGISNDQIARGLFLSINSIKTYVRTAYRKIGVTSRSQAVLWTVQHDIVAASASARTAAIYVDSPPRQ